MNTKTFLRLRKVANHWDLSAASAGSSGGYDPSFDPHDYDNPYHDKPDPLNVVTAHARRYRAGGGTMPPVQWVNEIWMPRYGSTAMRDWWSRQDQTSPEFVSKFISAMDVADHKQRGVTYPSDNALYYLPVEILRSSAMTPPWVASTLGRVLYTTPLDAWETAKLPVHLYRDVKQGRWLGSNLMDAYDNNDASYDKYIYNPIMDFIYRQAYGSADSADARFARTTHTLAGIPIELLGNSYVGNFIGATRTAPKALQVAARVFRGADSAADFGQLLRLARIPLHTAEWAPWHDEWAESERAAQTRARQRLEELLMQERRRFNPFNLPGGAPTLSGTVGGEYSPRPDRIPWYAFDWARRRPAQIPQIPRSAGDWAHSLAEWRGSELERATQVKAEAGPAPFQTLPGGDFINWRLVEPPQPAPSAVTAPQPPQTVETTTADRTADNDEFIVDVL